MRKWLCSAGLLALMLISAVACACTAENGEIETSAVHVDKELFSEAPVTEVTVFENTDDETPDTSEEESIETYQSMIGSRDWDAEESYLLAKIAMAEAEGESTEVKALVICTVLNRVWSDKFPNTIEAVLFQRTNNGGWQFSPMYEGGRWYTAEPNEDCWLAVEAVMQGWDESCGALYFESAEDPTWHSRNLHFLFKEGNVKFYRERDNNE